MRGWGIARRWYNRHMEKVWRIWEHDIGTVVGLAALLALIAAFCI